MLVNMQPILSTTAVPERRCYFRSFLTSNQIILYTGEVSLQSR